MTLTSSHLNLLEVHGLASGHVNGGRGGLQVKHGRDAVTVWQVLRPNQNSRRALRHTACSQTGLITTCMECTRKSGCTNQVIVAEHRHA